VGNFSLFIRSLDFFVTFFIKKKSKIESGCASIRGTRNISFVEFPAHENTLAS